MTKLKQIIALGGGGFSEENDNTKLDSYILAQVKKEKPKICFIPTASGDADGYIKRFKQAFEKMNCEPVHLSLFSPPCANLESFIMGCDVIYVGGGNTRNLLALWREWELDKYLRRAWNNGIVMAGISAGAICWFEQGLTDSSGVGYDCINCLGFLKGSCSPHFDSELERKLVMNQLIDKKEMHPGYGIDDCAAIHFVDQDVRAVVRSKPGAQVHYMSIESSRNRTIDPIDL